MQKQTKNCSSGGGGGGNGKVTKNSEINNSKQIYEVDFGSKARMQCAENHADGLDSPP